MQLSVPSKLAVCYIGKFIYVSMAYSILTVALEARLVDLLLILKWIIS